MSYKYYSQHRNRQKVTENSVRIRYITQLSIIHMNNINKHNTINRHLFYESTSEPQRCHITLRTSPSGQSNVGGDGNTAQVLPSTLPSIPSFFWSLTIKVVYYSHVSVIFVLYFFFLSCKCHFIVHRVMNDIDVRFYLVNYPWALCYLLSVYSWHLYMCVRGARDKRDETVIAVVFLILLFFSIVLIF